MMPLFLNVIYRACKLGVPDSIVYSMMKRIGEIILHQNPNLICSVAFLMSKLQEQRSSLQSMASVPEDHESPTYDPMKRDPAYANADNACSWELILLESHYHPSVTKFVGHLLSNTTSDYDGDPLSDFSGASFLEKFAFKNPKIETHGVKRSHSRKSIFSRTIDSGSHKDLEQEVFFHKFFNEKAKRESQKLQIGEKQNESESEDDFADRLFESQLRNGDDDDSSADFGLDDAADWDAGTEDEKSADVSDTDIQLQGQVSGNDAGERVNERSSSFIPAEQVGSFLQRAKGTGSLKSKRKENPQRSKDRASKKSRSD